MPRARKQARALGTKAKFPDFIEPDTKTALSPDTESLTLA